MDNLAAVRLAIAARYSPQAAEMWRAASVVAGDWPGLAGAAVAARLGPLLHDARRHLPAGVDPTPEVPSLRDSYYETASANVVLLEQLRDVMSALGAAGIVAAALKGASLILNAYDNLALRPMGDLDILVRPADREAAHRVLAGLGYRPLLLDPFPNRRGLFWNQLPFALGDRAAAVLELHWNLLDIPHYARRLPPEDLLARATAVPLDGEPVLCLAPADMLRHLCAHDLYHHRGSFDLTGVDIAVLLARRGREIDWDAYLEGAIEGDLVLASQVALGRAAAEWFAPVPEDVLDRLAGLRPRRLERFFLASQRSEFLKIARTWATLPGLSLRLAFLGGQLFPSGDYLRWSNRLRPGEPLARGYARHLGRGLAHLGRELRPGRPVAGFEAK